MKATKQHISLETAKLLKDCGVESQLAYIKENSQYTAVNILHWEVVDGEWGGVRRIVFEETKDVFEIQGIYAYTWNEILWENAELFFGEEIVKVDLTDGDLCLLGGVSDCGFDDMGYAEISMKAYVFHTTIIKNKLQKKKYEEADLYFREHCILINN